MLCIRKKIFTFVKVKKIDRFDLKNVVNRKKSRLTDFSFRDFLIENASCPLHYCSGFPCKNFKQRDFFSE